MIMKQVDETCFALRLDLAREKKLREEVLLPMSQQSFLAGIAAISLQPN